jgi:nucleoside-diphosphate-sugar epimerase
LVIAMDILLFGASGFVGRALLREIAALPAGSIRVRALLRNPDAVPDYPFLDKVKGSLESLPEGLEPARPYVLVHFAVKHIDRDGTGYLATNVDATQRLLGSLGPGPMGVLYASSMAVYGRGAQDGVTEAAPLSGDTPLAESRLRAEAVVQEAARARKISAFVLRPRFVVGEGDQFVLPGLAKVTARGLGIASGEQRFSVIDVADYARILLRLAEQVAERHRNGAPVQQALNVGHAEPVSFAQIQEALRASLGLRAPRVRLPVTLGITRSMRRVPLRALDQAATRLELVGFSHWGDVSALAKAVGDDIVRKDPMTSIRRAAEALAKTQA